ncbi:unnamed protein product [Callosobruchus maculatus]|uniref:Uncharacterized protein n=1 Tax=Callosobruchus maculatus TaxID=64391 RepID=A0A653BUS9_CALMS|nr:unnamed protein product [Callosobruchus maculatus]
MNAGPLPPVPALIPISALRKAAGNNGPQEMGEQQQRPPRPSSNQPRIDSCGGGERPAAAAAAAAASAAVARKTQRSPRHHRRKCRAPRTRPPQNRINPIFVWVKQEDTRIVDVKCEDYDKRNRILLTKTAQGWRAIPRTETLVPSLKDAASTEDHAAHHHHHHHHHKSKKSRKNKVRRRSTGVQVTSDLEEDEEPEQEESEAKEDDLESLLPSHTIKVNRAVTPQTHDEDVEVNVNVNTAAATVQSDVTPLDNLLAVAELEFNQQVRSGEWEEKSDEQGDKEFDLDLIEPSKKSEECDYTEEDDNNIAMDDILSRLEQSLQSPECTEVHTNFESEVTKVNDENANDASDNETTVPEFQSDPKPDVDPPHKETEEEEHLPVVESSTVDDEEPKDLTVKSVEANDNDCDVLDEPTDLSIPKKSSSPPPRPVSQNSEAIQSPQPSGIPAVPPSPDIVSTTVNSKSKSVFLESLLANTTNKIELNSEVTITRQAEPLDLGKCSRKSASPTVTCSEEVSSVPESEPPSKKFKPSVDITIKNILDVEEQKPNDAKSKEKSQTETPKLIELLKNDSEPNALVQLKQLLADPSINVPDPILIPKDKFTTILMKPGVEIPKLLKERPELRLPEALAYPHIMQDPNMLVLNVHDLEAILASRCGQGISDKEKNETKKAEKEQEKEPATKEKGEQKKVINELANDIDVATQTVFNQMLWLPYLNQLESMGYNSNTELMKMLSGSLPFYPNQMADLSHMFGTVPFPGGVPLPMQPLNYGNLIEMRMWQQAMMQADMLRNKSTMENMNNKYPFKDYLEKNSTNLMRKNSTQSSMSQMMQTSNKQHYPSGAVYTNGHSGYQNPYANMNPHQSSNSRINAQRSAHRNNSYAQRQHTNHSYQQNQQKQLEATQHLYNLAELEKQHQCMQSLSGLNQEFNIPQRRELQQKPKVTCKPFASLSNKPVESRSEFARHSVHHAPMDLSGMPSLASRQKIKQHHMDLANAAKLQAMKHHDDVAEVGSTTASIEEMQDAHKHLWHPLFGSQQGQQGNKGYPVPGVGAYGGMGSPWPWPGVTASAGAGE